MKYKALKSVAHNFSHSFVSFNNYVDNGIVMNDLRLLARWANGERIRILWIPEHGANESLSPRILKSVEYYKAYLERFVHASDADISAILEFRTEVYLKPNKQIAVEGHIVDDRGRTYISPVYDF